MEIAAAATALATFQTARDGLSHWSGQVKLCSRATLAATAMAGLHLRALRVLYFGERNPNGGRPKKTPHAAEFPDWPSMLTDFAGISDDTAGRWMKVADAIEALAEKHGGDVISICRTAPWDWTPEESEALGNAVGLLTQDKTQRELLQSDFLSSLGYEAPEKTNGSNNPSRNNGGRKAPAATPQAKVEANRLIARTALFGHDSKDHRPKPGSPAFWMNALIDADGKGELAKHPAASLTKKERADIYDLLIKPFVDSWKALDA